MARFPRPAEGTWTEHHPELGTGPVSFEDSVSPVFYELEREAIFRRAWLYVGRVEQLPRVRVRGRALPARRAAPHGEHQRHLQARLAQGAPLPRRGAHAQREHGPLGRAGPGQDPGRQPVGHRSLGHRQLPGLPESRDPDLRARLVRHVPLQDAGTLDGTQMGLEQGAFDEFPLNDQEILVRHFHKTVGDWVAAYARERAAGTLR